MVQIKCQPQGFDSHGTVPIDLIIPEAAAEVYISYHGANKFEVWQLKEFIEESTQTKCFFDMQAAETEEEEADRAENNANDALKSGG